MNAPLALKRQRALANKRRSGFSSVASVVVDTGVFHLDEPFSYGIPSELADRVHIGSHVKVLFRNKRTNGIVVSFSDHRENLPLQPIQGIIDRFALSPTTIDLCERLADRHASSLQSLFRFAVPGFAIQDVEEKKPSERQGNVSKSRKFLLVENQPPEEALLNFIPEEPGRYLVIADTLRNANDILGAMRSSSKERSNFSIIDLTGNGNRQTNRHALLQARDAHSFVAVGMRGSIFSNLGSLDHVFVLEEWSEHHVERNAPYWNTRDVSLIRQDLEGFELTFVGTSPSMELARLIETGFIEMPKKRLEWKRSRPRVHSLPESYQLSISKALKRGNVLISVASKSYVKALICQKCRSRATCYCGGAIEQLSEARYVCQLCQTAKSEITCTECQHTRFLMLHKGTERIAVEIAKAFPRHDVFVVDAEKGIDLPPSSQCIVISTMGAEPKFKEGFAGFVFLDGEYLTSRPKLRADESVWQRWRRALSMASKEVDIYFTLSSNHPIVQSVIAGKASIFLSRLLESRKAAHLPPYYKLISISGEVAALRNLAASLKKETQVPIEVFPINKQDEITIKVSVAQFQEIMQLLKVVQRYRSTRGKELLAIKLDPLDI